MKEFQTNSRGEVSRDEYIKVFKSVGFILRPEIDENDLEQIIKEDFEKDATGNPKIGDEEKTHMVPEFLEGQKLFDSIFELADTWCPDIDEF